MCNLVADSKLELVMAETGAPFDPPAKLKVCPDFIEERRLYLLRYGLVFGSGLVYN